MKVKVENGEITQIGLPKVGELKNGTTVSGYYLLSEVTLLQEGWLPLEDVEPNYNAETQELVHTGYDIQIDKVVKLYTVLDIPAEEVVESPEELRINALESELAQQKKLIDAMLGVTE